MVTAKAFGRIVMYVVASIIALYLFLGSLGVWFANGMSEDGPKNSLWQVFSPYAVIVGFMVVVWKINDAVNR